MEALAMLIVIAVLVGTVLLAIRHRKALEKWLNNDTTIDVDRKLTSLRRQLEDAKRDMEDAQQEIDEIERLEFFEDIPIPDDLSDKEQD